MKTTDQIAKDLFEKIRSRFASVTIADVDARSTQEPNLARFFNFDFVDSDNNSYGNVTISIIDNEHLKVYYGKNISDQMPQQSQQEWYGFLRDLRMFAKQNLLKFDARDITRPGLTPRDIKQSSVNDRPYTVKDVALGESRWSGNSRYSYDDFGQAKVIIKHVRAQDPTARRTSNIGAVYLGNPRGERFLLPFRSIRGARALAQHLNQGGQCNDAVYSKVCGLVKSMNKMKKYLHGCRHAPTPASRQVAQEYNLCKKVLDRMGNPRYYHWAIDQMPYSDIKHADDDSFEPVIDQIRQTHSQRQDIIEQIHQGIIQGDLVNRAAASLETVMPAVKFSSPAAMARKVWSVVCELDADPVIREFAEYWAESYGRHTPDRDYQRPTAAQFAAQVVRAARRPKLADLPADPGPVDLIDSVIRERWQEQDVKQQKRHLSDIMSAELPFGNDGVNATGALWDTELQNDQLFDLLYNLSQKDPDADSRPAIQDWVQSNRPDWLDIFEPEAEPEVEPEAEPEVEPEAEDNNVAQS
jgi:hypothetical protein